MTTTRRRFIESAAAGAAALALPSTPAFASSLPRTSSGQPPGSVWDLTWADRLTARHKAVFDCTETESGNGVWRASLWRHQYIDVLKVAPADVTAVVVLRHNAILLAMQQAFWDKYGIGVAKKVLDPVTEKPSDMNPAIAGNAGLTAQLAAGTIVLACNMALQDCVYMIRQKEKISEEEAQKRAVAALVPGVILQPSGVFATIRAQEAGAMYLKAS